MKTIREIILGAEVMGLAMLFGTGLYESLVNAPNFVTNIPVSALIALSKPRN